MRVSSRDRYLHRSDSRVVNTKRDSNKKVTKWKPLGMPSLHRKSLTTRPDLENGSRETPYLCCHGGIIFLNLMLNSKYLTLTRCQLASRILNARKADLVECQGNRMLALSDWGLGTNGASCPSDNLGVNDLLHEMCPLFCERVMLRMPVPFSTGVVSARFGVGLYHHTINIDNRS
jgi:hypothetical protein